MRPSAGKVARARERVFRHSPGFPCEDRGFFMRVTLSLIASFLFHLGILFLVGLALLALREKPAPPGVVVIEVGLHPVAGQEKVAQGQDQNRKSALAPDQHKRTPVSHVGRKSPTPLPVQKKIASSTVFAELSPIPPSTRPSAQPQQKTNSSSLQTEEKVASRPGGELKINSVEAEGEAAGLPPALSKGSQISAEVTGNNTGSDLRAHCLFCPQPEYPLRARQEGWEGQVEVVLVVREDGTAAEVDLRRSSGYRALDRAALRVARQSRFTPALQQGSPTVVRGQIRYQFKLVVE